MNWEKVFELKFLFHSSPSLPIGNYYSAQFKYKFQHDQLTNLTGSGNQNHKRRIFLFWSYKCLLSPILFSWVRCLLSRRRILFSDRNVESTRLKWDPSGDPGGEYGAQSHCHHHLHCHESTSPSLCRQHKQHCFLNIIFHAVLQSSSSILIYLCNIGSSQRSFRLLTSGGAPGGVCDSIAPSRLSHTSHPHQSQANLK